MTEPKLKNKIHKTAAETILGLIERQGPMFASQISRTTGILMQSVLENCNRMCKAKDARIGKRKVEIPLHMRQHRVKRIQWQFYVLTDAPAVPAIPQMPTMKPLRGSGLYGRPIVMRPGSDWALQSDPYISMEARS